MATYYVRTDGSNANAGTGSATNQAWATIAYALANMTLTTGVNTLYIAPGVYRESVTLTVTPTASNTLVVAGDPTAAQFSGVTPNQVRVTGAVDNSSISPFGVTRIDTNAKPYLTIQDVVIEGGTGGGAPVLLISGTNTTIDRVVVYGIQTGGSTGSNIGVEAPNTTGNAITIKNSTIIGGGNGMRLRAPVATSGVSGIVIQNCRILAGYISTGYGIYVQPSSGTTMASVFVTNCFIHGASSGVYFERGNTTNTHTVQNCIISACGTGINAFASSTTTQQYNIINSTTTLTNVATSVTTVYSDFLGIDLTQNLLQGFGSIAPFGTLLSSRNTAFGTASNAPATDAYGIAWTGATPDVGAATYRSLSGIGSYLPTERNASAITIAPGSTSQSIELYLGVTGLTASTSGLSARYNRTRTASVSIPLVARTIAQAWTAGGFAEVDAINMPGVYRLDLPDAALAAGADDVTIVVRGAAGTNGAVMTVKLSSGGLSSTETAQAVWNATASTYNTAGSMGEAGQKLTGYSLASSQTFSTTGAVGSVTGAVTVGTNNDKTGYALSSAGNTASADAVWNATRSTHTTAGTFGQYVNAELVTPVTQSALVRMGPFQVIADGVATPMPLDIQKGAQHGVDIQCVDNNLSAIDITSATVTAKVYNSGGTLVDTYSCTATYAADGRATFTIDTTVTNTPGTYTATITRTTGASDTQIFGPLRIYVRDI